MDKRPSNITELTFHTFFVAAFLLITGVMSETRDTREDVEINQSIAAIEMIAEVAVIPAVEPVLPDYNSFRIISEKTGFPGISNRDQVYRFIDNTNDIKIKQSRKVYREIRPGLETIHSLQTCFSNNNREVETVS